MAAAVRWPREGVPANPAGWLYHVATRRMADRIRSETARRAREDAVAASGGPWAEWAFVPGPEADPDVRDDDALALLFMACHPSLTPASAIALTLRAVGGLTTAEIARAFLVPEATMAQRISRAKRTIRDSGVPFALPGDDERPRRLAAVLHVLYLMFNEGVALLPRALGGGRAGPYALQAAIAALHDEAPTADATDWPQIRALYELLLGVSEGNPMVALGHAVAIAMVRGPAAGLALLDALDVEGKLAGHYRLDAVRGHLHERAGDADRAVAHFLAAADGTSSLPERDFLRLKAARLAATSDATPLRRPSGGSGPRAGGR